MTISMTLK